MTFLTAKKSDLLKSLFFFRGVGRAELWGEGVSKQLKIAPAIVKKCFFKGGGVGFWLT